MTIRKFTHNHSPMVPLLLIVALTSISGCSSPNLKQGVFAGEHLITPFYADVEDWQIKELQQGNFSSRIWQQPGKGMADAYSVSVFYENTLQISEKRQRLDEPGLRACDTFSSTTLQFPGDSPYPFAYWETLCVNDNGTRAKLLHLLIQGTEKLYHIQKSWQGEIPKDIVEQWKARFERIFVCDTRTNIVECPTVQKIDKL